MHVIGHQTPRVEPNLPLFHLLQQVCEVVAIVGVFSENRLSVMPTVNNVVREGSEEYAWVSWHPGTSLFLDESSDG
jgi:hypothetical protein